MLSRGRSGFKIKLEISGKNQKIVSDFVHFEMVLAYSEHFESPALRTPLFRRRLWQLTDL